MTESMPEWKTTGTSPDTRGTYAIFFRNEEPFLMVTPIIAWATQQMIGNAKKTRVVGMTTIFNTAQAAPDFSNFDCYMDRNQIRRHRKALIERAKREALIWARHLEASEFKAEKMKMAGAAGKLKGGLDPLEPTS